jgi:hypothetical protein
VSRAKPIGWHFQCFGKELEKLVAESMTGVAKVCYGVDFCREGLGKGLVGFVAVEFTKVEGSRGALVLRYKMEEELLYSLKSPL